MKKSCLVLCALVFSLIPCRAGVILSDAFNYPDGPLVTASGSQWSSYSGTAGQIGVVSGRIYLNKTNSEDVHAALLGAPYTAVTGTFLYASFTLNVSNLPTAGGDYIAEFKAGGTADQRGRVFVGKTGSTSVTYRLGVANTNGSPTATLTNELSTNVSYTVVLRYAVSNASSTLWINPTAETDISVTATEAASATSVSYFGFREPGSAIGNLFVDDLLVGTSFADVVLIANAPPVITTQPQDQTATAGDNVSFTVVAGGTAPLSYQWKSNSVNVAGATNNTFTILSVTTGLNGSTYSVTVTNAFGSTNSPPATLTVNPASVPGYSLLTYNVMGNGATNWTTNALQVQAIGRELMYLNPDIITFNEIPHAYTNEMLNWVMAFLPGYHLAISPGSDTYIHTTIASRFPIARFKSWLDGAQLEPWDYTNSNFTRDLLEAEIVVPGFPRHLHVFTAHLKSSSGNYADDAAKRAAEAAAITNWFSTNFFVLYPNDPYTLSGDMNESDTNTLAIQRLLSPSMDSHLTNPINPFTGSINTYSIKPGASLSERIDYIFPCGLLFSNIASSQVFRTDKLNPVPLNLNSNDDKVASDHLPVMMVFNNPYDKPFQITSLTRSNPAVTLRWQSVLGQPYRVDSSSNLTVWSVLASNLTASSNAFTFVTNMTDEARFFRVYRVP